MNTLQHSLITAIKIKDINKFKQLIPYILLPDAIRYYTKNRKFSHFETEPLTGESNILIYPKEIKSLDKININDYILKDVPLKQASVGESTSLSAFENNNKHLDDDVYVGIKEHLNQDILFDNWIRQIFDCSNKYQDTYKVNDVLMDGSEFRRFISEFEMDGLVCLAYKYYKEFGIKTNNQWFKENVFQSLADLYPDSMYVSTCKYMIIPDEINDMITNCKWKELVNSRKYLKMFNYEEFYQEVIDLPINH